MDEKEAEARPVMGIIFLVIGRAKRAPHWGDPSRFRVIYNKSVCRMSVVCQISCVGGITYGQPACSKSFFGGYHNHNIEDSKHRRYLESFRHVLELYLELKGPLMTPSSSYSECLFNDCMCVCADGRLRNIADNQNAAFWYRT